jgi:lipopolysaccharide transport system ATP-binding protein
LPTSSETAVELRDVTKVYELGELASFTRTLRTVGGLLTRHRPARKRFAALSDVSFGVDRGECLALLGENGSGKTTLASIMAGLTLPTRGEAIVHGRVIPLFAVGTGFQEELTGAENVELLATMLGLPRRARRAALPEVLEFAELDDARMGTPVSRFSQGMKARLSFATALRLPADVYIFDEVLSVADDHFKHQCAAEIERMVGAGRTVVFVSHELPLVAEVCSRGVWLDRGRVRMDGPIEQVTAAYAAAEEAREAREAEQPAPAARRGRSLSSA